MVDEIVIAPLTYDKLCDINKPNQPFEVLGMRNIGFIGFGSMGRMLVKGFIESGLVGRENIYVTRKDKNRLGEIRLAWPGINVAQTAAEVADRAECVFICVKPLEYRSVLEEIRPYLQPDRHLVSIAGTVAIKNIESIVDCKITKILPTVVSEVKEGMPLVCHNGRVGGLEADFVEALIGSVSKVKRVEERAFGLASELTSCGPGLFAAVFREFAGAALRRADGLDAEDVEEMVLQTLYGTAKLMVEKEMGFDEVVSRVATKGGITEEGVKVIEAGMPQVFEELFERTLEKRRAVGEKLEKDFCIQS